METNIENKRKTDFNCYIVNIFVIYMIEYCNTASQAVFEEAGFSY